MKKFDFFKEFGKIDSKYIHEAEDEWKAEKKIWMPKPWNKVAAACVVVAFGFVFFSNPYVQAAMKNLTLSIGETLGFSKEIESYTDVLDASKTENGITVTLKEVVVDDGVLLAKIHAQKADLKTQDETADSKEFSFANLNFDIDAQNSTINGQKIEEYGSGSYLPYSVDELMENGLDENVYDGVLESRFNYPVEIGESPKVHLVLGAYDGEELERNPFAIFQFDFSISHAELMKQTIHKELTDTAIETGEGTVKLTKISMNKLQSSITAEIPDELYGKYEMELLGTDSKGNPVRYELSESVENEVNQWEFKTSFWGMYLMTEEPVLLIPDVASEYMELQLYIREPYMLEEDIIWEDDTYIEVGETAAEEIMANIQDSDHEFDTDEQPEKQIIGGATASTEIMLEENEEEENTDMGEESMLADDSWIAVGDKIKIQLQ